MKKRGIFKYAVFCLTLLVFLVPQISAGWEEMEVLKNNLAISTTPRHEWNPWVEYNSVDDEFLVIWRTSGILREDCDPDDDYECTKSFQSIDAARISPDGEILGKPTVSPPEGPLDNVSWKSMPRIAHNRFRNEHMVIFTMSHDTCVQCHDRNAETGEPETTNPGVCIECHPGADPGSCNLVTFHDAKGANCLTCHADCVGGSPPVPPTPHPDSCMGCHILEGSGGIHYRLGHTTSGSKLYKTRIDNLGNVLFQPDLLYEPARSSGHPTLTFNSVRRQYLIGTGDYFFTAEVDGVGFIVDEDTNVLNGPFFFGEGSDGSWTHVLYYAVYNPIDDTYLIPWEDFRHAAGAWYFGPNDIYAALLDGDGNTLADIPVIEDAAEGEYEQWYPCVAHNPDRNEFLVTWFDERPIVVDGGIVGRVFNSDGTPKGEPFVVADAPGSQGDMALVYAEKYKKYFMVWQDTRNYIPAPDDPAWYRENDIYARWLDENGLPVGDAFPIHIGEGDQSMPQMVYSPVSDRFLIVWWDFHAPDDYEPLPGEFGGEYGELSSIPMGALTAGNVRGAIYGAPPSVLLNIGDQWANCGDVGVKIPICLINLEAEVGAVQVDLCENVDDCLICVGCEMTERTTIFDCMVNELENGCCAVVVFSKNPGGVINPGECDIVVIDYTIRDEPQCCDNCIEIVGENPEVVDQYGYIVDTLVGGYPGMVCPFECGDVEPATSTATIWDCGDGDIDIFDILEEVDFIIHVKTPDECQAVRADVPTGTPPNCESPDDVIDVGDLMVIIDMALNRQDCCSYYYGGVIY